MRTCWVRPTRSGGRQIVTDPIVEWDDERREVNILIDPDDEWREIVYTGKAVVTLSRGCPHCWGEEDRIVEVNVKWEK